jgi:hypothetical protein
VVAPATAIEPPAEPETVDAAGTGEARRRFTRAAILGVILATPFYLSVLWGGSLDPFRSYYPDHSFANFYEAQARALFHGHWNVPIGSLGIEGFVSRGREYTYFGPFPSLLRMPLLILTSRFDGRLTAPSMLLAWLISGLCFSLLLWQVRVFLRGQEPLGRAEATAYGALIATVLSGSVLLYLAETPMVYQEDVAWGVAMTLGALTALFALLQRPNFRGVLIAGLLVLGANLSRAPLGWACVIGAVLTSGWFGFGYGGAENRRWWRPMLMAGVVPLLVTFYVTWAKFGIPIGLPYASQVWTQIDQHRRDFLAANGGKAFSLRFLPTTLATYLRPDGIRLTRVFPFITLPAGPPRILGHAVFDQTYRTASITATMPLLSVLTMWGIVSVFFRPRTARRILWILLVTAAAGVSGVLAVGYIANRYLADFLPLLCLGSAIGLVDLFVRVARRADRTASTATHWVTPRRALTAGVLILAVVGVAANVALSSTPDDPVGWQAARVQDYVRKQEAFSKYMGHPLAANVDRGPALPPWAPADRLFILGNCSALYISTGETYHTWIPVDLGPDLRQAFDVSVQRPAAQITGIALVQVGRSVVSTVRLEQLGTQVRATLDDPLFAATSPWLSIAQGRPARVTVDVDSQLHTVAVALGGRTLIDSPLSTAEQDITRPAISGTLPAPTLAIVTRPVPVPSLCRDLS